MSIRTRTNALATGPGEALRKRLGLEETSDNCGKCAQIARAASQYATHMRGHAEGDHKWHNKAHAMRLRLSGLVDSLGPGYSVKFGLDESTSILHNGPNTVLRIFI